MTYAKGADIAGYTVLFPHTESDYAETYRVRAADGTTCFMKLIDCSRLSPCQVDASGEIVEVAVWRTLAHPNLCRYIADGVLTAGGVRRVWVVSEYVSGETVPERVRRSGRMPVYEIRLVVHAVLSALAALHNASRPVAHGEVSAQNVLLPFTATAREARLIDLGHARYVDQPLAKPDLDMVAPFYLANECFAGMCTPQTDLYAVGALMYYLVYGTLPWAISLSRVSSQQDRADAVIAAREHPLAMPPVELFDYDECMRSVICKALASDPRDRFQSADEFLAALDSGVALSAPPARQTESAAPLCRPRKQGAGFEAVAGMEELKRQMTEEVIEPLHNPEEYRRYGVTIPNGMLLYGPPGCGKTFFAKHFAEEVGFNFMCVTPATLKSRWVNATQENIAAMFKEAAEKAPTVIFIDEINEMLPSRESDVHEMSRSAVNEMLAQMDRTGERGVFVIGATNYPQSIDAAILRAGRLDRKYYVGFPDVAARRALFELYLNNRPRDLGIDYDTLAARTDGYVSADIALIVNDAARAALRQHVPISQALLLAAVSAQRPSVSPRERDRYERIHREMSEGADAPQHPRVGFR